MSGCTLGPIRNETLDGNPHLLVFSTRNGNGFFEGKKIIEPGSPSQVPSVMSCQIITIPGTPQDVGWSAWALNGPALPPVSIIYAHTTNWLGIAVMSLGEGCALGAPKHDTYGLEIFSGTGLRSTISQIVSCPLDPSDRGEQLYLFPDYCMDDSIPQHNRTLYKDYAIIVVTSSDAPYHLHIKHIKIPTRHCSILRARCGPVTFGSTKPSLVILEADSAVSTVYWRENVGFDYSKFRPNFLPYQNPPFLIQTIFIDATHNMIVAVDLNGGVAVGFVKDITRGLAQFFVYSSAYFDQEIPGVPELLLGDAPYNVQLKDINNDGVPEVLGLFKQSLRGRAQYFAAWISFDLSEIEKPNLDTDKMVTKIENFFAPSTTRYRSVTFGDVMRNGVLDVVGSFQSTSTVVFAGLGCGNGIVDGYDEECDSTPHCDEQCKCEASYTPKAGECYDSPNAPLEVTPSFDWPPSIRPPLAPRPPVEPPFDLPVPDPPFPRYDPEPDRLAPILHVAVENPVDPPTDPPINAPVSLPVSPPVLPPLQSNDSAPTDAFASGGDPLVTVVIVVVVVLVLVSGVFGSYIAYRRYQDQKKKKLREPRQKSTTSEASLLLSEPEGLDEMELAPVEVSDEDEAPVSDAEDGEDFSKSKSTHSHDSPPGTDQAFTSDSISSNSSTSADLLPIPPDISRPGTAMDMAKFGLDNSGGSIPYFIIPDSSAPKFQPISTISATTAAKFAPARNFGSLPPTPLSTSAFTSNSSLGNNSSAGFNNSSSGFNNSSSLFPNSSSGFDSNNSSSSGISKVRLPIFSLADLFGSDAIPGGNSGMAFPPPPESSPPSSSIESNFFDQPGHFVAEPPSNSADIYTHPDSNELGGPNSAESEFLMAEEPFAPLRSGIKVTPVNSATLSTAAAGLEIGLKSSAQNPNYIIPANEVELISEIGRGAFGVVWKGRWRSTQVAVKRCSKVTDQQQLRSFLEEAQMLSTKLRRHPNITLCVGVMLEPQPAIVMEWMEGGSLDRWIYDQSQVISKQRMFSLILGISAGVLHIHSENILHRDLACRNVLLTRHGVPKLSDFGLALTLQADLHITKSGIGPARYMAPESLKSKQYSKASDIWSLAIVFAEIFSRQMPHHDKNIIDAALKIRDHGATPAVPSWTPNWLVALMKEMWAFKPEDRPTIHRVLRVLQDNIVSVT